MMSEEFPAIGGPIALDLINTRVRTSDGEEADLLADPQALERWLAAQNDRLPLPKGTPTALDLAAVHEIREHAAGAVHHARRGERPPERTLRAVADAQIAAPLVRELDWDGGRLAATSRRAGRYSARLVAELAAATVALVGADDITRVRQCERPGCILLFLPAHPQRRWCSETCGNRVRVARHYHRHRS
jgi:predicted RNA-binding Zn ribbon-like protein